MIQVNRKTCHGCGELNPTVHYTWVSRCETCSKAFAAALHEKKIAEAKKRSMIPNCEPGCDCGSCCIDCGTNFYEYTDDNGRCPGCAEEAHEHYMCAMMDAAKDARKYG